MPGISTLAAASAVVFALLASVPAQADPPAVGTEDYELLHPYSGWLERQNSPSGLLCCSIADGRPVSIRSTSRGWEALITKAKFGDGAPDGWVAIPQSAVLRVDNPSGLDVAWWYMGVIRCFAFAGKF